MTRALSLTSLFALAALATGCVPETGYPAPYGASITGVTDVTVSPSVAFAEEADGYALMLVLDFGVLDADGVPLSGVRMEFLSSFNGLVLLPQGAVSVADPPPEPEGDCEENFDENTCPWYDISSGQYYTLANDYGAGNEDAYRPNYAIIPTDNRGLVRLYGLLDAMPYTTEDDNGDGAISGDELVFSSVYLTASIAYATELIEIATDEAN